MALNFEKKLFYSYNSPWLHQSSLSYSQNYTYSVIFNKKNHKIIQNGTEYGTFHNSNYIACLPSDAFINETNTFYLNSANGNYFCIKVPAQASNWNSGTISFDVTLSSECGNAKYTISGKLGAGMGGPDKTWLSPRAVCVSNQAGTSNNQLSNLDVRFINYRCRVVGSTHCYWPVVAIGPTISIGASLPTTINISNISTSLNLNSSNLSYNFIDTSANLDHKWETSLKTSLDATYYVSKTIINPLVQAHNANQAVLAQTALTATQAQYANQFTHTVNIWGQSFDGTNGISGDFILNSTNYWQKFQTGSDNSSYLLRTAYLRVNSSNTTRTSLTDMNFAFDVAGDSRFDGYVGIGWHGPQKMYNKPVRLYITGDANLTRIHPSETNRFYSLVTEYGLHYLGDPVGIGTHPVLDDNTTGGTDGRGAMLTVRSTYPEDNRNPISIYSAGGDNILKGDTSIGINTFNGTPSRRLYIDGGSSNNYSIYSQNGQNYFSERVGIGIEPTNTAYMLNVNGKILAQSGVNVYGHGVAWNGTQYCAVNINNVSTASANQVIKVFCINSNQNGNVYSYWNCGIYTMKNADRMWTYNTAAATTYNLLLYTSDTSSNTSKALYSFSANPNYRGSVALNEGTQYNLVCLGIITIYRTTLTTTWSINTDYGNITCGTPSQPGTSESGPATANVIGKGAIRFQVSVKSTEYTTKGTLNICSAIPVINTVFSSGPSGLVTVSGYVQESSYPTLQVYANVGQSLTAATQSGKGQYVAVWADRIYYSSSAVKSKSDGLAQTGGAGSIASIKVTLFGYYT